MNLPEIPQPYNWILEGLLVLCMIWFVLKNDKPLKKAAEEIYFQHWMMILLILILLTSTISGIYAADDAELRLRIADIGRNIASWLLTLLFMALIIRFLMNRFRRPNESTDTGSET